MFKRKKTLSIEKRLASLEAWRDNISKSVSQYSLSVSGSSGATASSEVITTSENLRDIPPINNNVNININQQNQDQVSTTSPVTVSPVITSDPGVSPNPVSLTQSTNQISVTP